MNEQMIQGLVAQLDTKDALLQERVWAQLRPLGEVVMGYFEGFYPLAQKLEGRRFLLFHAIKYARVSESAFNLGVAALKDRSSIVRYRACCVLAYSQRDDAIPFLEQALGHKDDKTVEDARAAIDAITLKNHHYFVDRKHSGSVFWEVNKGDRLG